jgi:HTH-type transcriptional regulator / antitoxin HigA
MKAVKIIHTHEQYHQALARLSKFVDSDPVPDSLEADEMELLGLVIQHYERKQFPINPADPVEIIKFVMEQQGLKKKDLVPYMGSTSRVTEVLNGSRSLSLSMIRRLNQGLGVPMDLLVQTPGKIRA